MELNMSLLSLKVNVFYDASKFENTTSNRSPVFFIEKLSKFMIKTNICQWTQKNQLES